jgi:hypothetical protein
MNNKLKPEFKAPLYIVWEVTLQCNACWRTMTNTLLQALPRSFMGFGSIPTDIIIYRDIIRDKLLKITLSPGFVLIMFSRMTIFVVSRKFDSYSRVLVEIEH